MRTTLLYVILLMSSMANAQQISNAGYESWTGDPGAKDRPVDWQQLNSTLPSPLDAFVPQTCFKETIAHSGSFALRLLTVNTFQGPANGIATTGTIDYTNQIVNGGVAYTYRPDSLTGYYKTNPSSGDHGTIEYTLLDNAGDTIGRALFNAPGSAVTAWTRFSVPFVYPFPQAPDKAIALVSSSDGYNAVVGSEIQADDLVLIFNPVTVTESTLENVEVLARNNQVLVNTGNADLKNTLFSVYDLSGKCVAEYSLNGSSFYTFDLNVNSGLYIYKIGNGSSVTSGKLFIGK